MNFEAVRIESATSWPTAKEPKASPSSSVTQAGTRDGSHSFLYCMALNSTMFYLWEYLWEVVASNAVQLLYQKIPTKQLKHHSAIPKHHKASTTTNIQITQIAAETDLRLIQGANISHVLHLIEKSH